MRFDKRWINDIYAAGEGTARRFGRVDVCICGGGLGRSCVGSPACDSCSDLQRRSRREMMSSKRVKGSGQGCRSARG